MLGIMQEQHAQLIENLGGGTAIAAALFGGDPKRRQAVYKWKYNGIPWRWRLPVERLARERGVDLPPEFLEPSGSEG